MEKQTNKRTMSKAFYSVEEVAEILGVTRRSVYNYLTSGQLRASRPGKYWLISVAALEEFLTASDNQTGSHARNTKTTKDNA